MDGPAKSRVWRGKVCHCIERCGLLAAAMLSSVVLLAECSSRRPPHTLPQPTPVGENAPPPVPSTPPEPAPAKPASAPEAAAPKPEVEEGVASWYGPGFDGKPTANGEVYDQDAMTAAHPWLPFGTRVRVTLVATGRSVVVRINDRGPRHDRAIDLSRAAGRALGLIEGGVGEVRLQVLD
jgi:rare lipoprotein A (peptidoglycan hydrolase)